MNMSYCRFENTLNDFDDCLTALRNGCADDLSATERKKAKQLLQLAKEMADEFEEEDLNKPEEDFYDDNE